MADTYEKDLGQKSSLTTSDFIRVVGSDNVSYKQGINSVADRIGNINAIVILLTDCDDGTDPSKIYYANGNTANRPGNANWWFIKCEAASAQMRFQTAMQMNWSDPVVYQRSSTNQGTWGEWQKMPTRAEVDALNSKTKKGILVSTGESYALPLETRTAYLITMQTSSNDSGRVICVMRYGTYLIKAVLYEGSYQSYYTETLQNDTWEISDVRFTTILNIIEF